MKFDRVKIMVNIPHENVEAVRLAAGKAGAGILGEYSYCAFTMAGLGYFQGSEKANPVVGEKGRIEKVEEMKLEVVCDKSVASQVAKAIIEAHPYEEVPLEVLPLIRLEDLV